MKIKVSDQGIMIPREFLPNVDEVDIRIEDDRILIMPISRAKSSDNHSNTKQNGSAFLLSLAGMFDTGINDTSEHVSTVISDFIMKKYGEKSE